MPVKDVEIDRAYAWIVLKLEDAGLALWGAYGEAPT